MYFWSRSADLVRLNHLFHHYFSLCCYIFFSLSQPADADVVARPAEDGGSQPEGPDEHELHQVAQQPGRPADCVRFWSVLKTEGDAAVRPSTGHDREINEKRARVCVCVPL